MFIEALGDGAVAYGLGREAAYRLCAQMMAGTAKQLLVHPQHPGQLKDRVSSRRNDDSGSCRAGASWFSQCPDFCNRTDCNFG